MNSRPMARENLMTRSRIDRTVHRMAHELAELTTENPVLLLGINERGLALAGALHLAFERFGLGTTTLIGLDADSLLVDRENPSHDTSTEPAQEEWQQIRDHTGVLVLCDDVIFSGKTLFYTLKRLPTTSATKAIYLATLIDRGHRQFPVSPSVCGLTLPTKQGEHITVEVSGGADINGVLVPSLESVILELDE